jgi:hypothetical protein
MFMSMDVWVTDEWGWWSKAMVQTRLSGENIHCSVFSSSSINSTDATMMERMANYTRLGL